MELPGYGCPLTEDGVQHSKMKLQQVANELSSFVPKEKISMVPCSIRNSNADTKEEEEEEEWKVNNLCRPPPAYQWNGHDDDDKVKDETLNYRCSCAFQMIKKEPSSPELKLKQQESQLPPEELYEYEYAMRKNGIPIPLNSDYFPIATKRIQTAMKNVLAELNSHSSHAMILINNKPVYIHDFYLLRENLESIQFDSSWSNHADCIATFNYSTPIGSDDDQKQNIWKQQAGNLKTLCGLTNIILRSKKRMIISEELEPPCLRDTLLLKIIYGDTFTKSVTAKLIPYRVFATFFPKPSLELYIEYDIYYHKPFDAFQHPNSNAMIQALNWMLRILRDISYSYLCVNNNSSSTQKEAPKIGLLEMYCGCGAHTMPIAKSGLFNFIAAVEIDQRLVDACQNNCRLNKLPSSSSSSPPSPPSSSNRQFYNMNVAKVDVFQGDAGEWASKSIIAQRKKRLQHQDEQLSTSTTTAANATLDTSIDSTNTAKASDTPIMSTSTTTSNKSHWYNQQYHVLLVDPPRKGLDEKVCTLAKEGSFEHIIYISCGRDALIRDLRLLGDCFEVEDCLLTDLFPRTYSVETLVHLKRK